MKDITPLELIDILKRLSTTQKKLLERYLSINPNGKTWAKTGKIFYNGETWLFRKHSAGVYFKNQQTNAEIDAHTDIENSPDLLDSWRLETYFSSIEPLNLILKNHNYNLASPKQLTLAIQHIKETQDTGKLKLTT
ncbi:hypothetical protein WIN67_19180 [Pseudomonas idahonensis]|uniref:DUF6896 domain-containing protein n=1 Tax=Pseudomonas idahonensis TaxID=2942628 RepID=UPI0030CDBF75